MNHRSYQFGISSMMWWVAFSALNFWLCTLGACGIIVAVVIDKHVLVAYLCWAARVDRRESEAMAGTLRKPA